MKKLCCVAFSLGAFASLAGAAYAQVHVDGYYRRDGTYVQPHYRSAPDGNPFNNYSTQGNINPYTGEPGHVNPYAQPYSSEGYRPYQPQPFSSVTP